VIRPRKQPQSSGAAHLAAVGPSLDLPLAGSALLSMEHVLIRRVQLILRLDRRHKVSFGGRSWRCVGNQELEQTGNDMILNDYPNGLCDLCHDCRPNAQPSHHWHGKRPAICSEISMEGKGWVVLHGSLQGTVSAAYAKMHSTEQG
jgi:hypothetical protein